MDERVKAAMQQWPNVPACYGWLSLTRRGQWLLKGESISNRQLLDFIGRNYVQLPSGEMAFQNGPQRVFVDCELAPFVFTIPEPEAATLGVQSHHGVSVEQILQVLLDEQGHLWLQSNVGIGVLDDRDFQHLFTHFCQQDGTAAPLDFIEEQLERLMVVELGAPAELAVRHGDACVPIARVFADDLLQEHKIILHPQEKTA